MIAVDGPADRAAREAALARLVQQAHGEHAASAAAACGGHAPRGVLSGVLLMKENGANRTATFELDAKDCAGKTLFQQSATREGASVTQAVQRAVDAAVDAYLNPPRRGRRLWPRPLRRRAGRGARAAGRPRCASR